MGQHSRTCPPPCAIARAHRLKVGGALGAWVVLVFGLFLALGRERARVMMPDSETLATLAEAGAAGWRARHVLGTEPALNDILVRHWLQRGVVLGLQEELYVSDTLPRPEGLEQLAARGWRIHHLSGPGSRQAKLELLSPDGTLAWSGVYTSSDILISGALIWDQQAMVNITRGSRLPPFVPTGCAPPVPPTAAPAFAWITRPSPSL